MEQEGLCAVGRIVLYNKEQLVLVRPLENLICMTMLKYATQVKAPETFADEVKDCEIDPQEYKLAKTLIRQITIEDFDLNDYRDQYTERLNELIERPKSTVKKSSRHLRARMHRRLSISMDGAEGQHFPSFTD